MTPLRDGRDADRPTAPTGLASLALGVFRQVDREQTAQLHLSRQDRGRLRRLLQFLESAKRGTDVDIGKLRESRNTAYMSADPSTRARFPSIEQDVATMRLVLGLLETNDKREVVRLADGLEGLLDSMSRPGTLGLGDNDRRFIEEDLRPFLFRLAHANDSERYRSTPGRHVLLV